MDILNGNTMENDMSKVGKLNISIASNEKEILEIYKVIGEAYYKDNSKSTSYFCKEQINKINELNAEIIKIKNEICAIKGLVCCPSCGHEVSNKARFCNKCGKAIRVIEETDTNKCSKCGADIEEGSKFCLMCGNAVDETKNEANESVIKEENLVCSNCDNKLLPGMKFCNKCGTKVN